MKIFEHEGFEGTTYHKEGVECGGCNKKFCYTVKEQEDGEKYCKLCYNHRFGTDEMKKVEKKLDELNLSIYTVILAAFMVLCSFY